MGRVAILGVFVADTSFRANRMPRMGETILGRSFALGPGGKGSNQAVAAGKLGADVSIITRLGRDDFGKMALQTWKNANVKSNVILDPEGHTGAAFIFIDNQTGDNAIIISPGTADQISLIDIQKNKDLISGSDVFMTQLEQPIDVALAGLKLAKQHGKITILNPAPAAQLQPDIFALCDYITPNETEAEALTGVKVETEGDAERAAEVFVDLGVKTPIVTMGGKGAYLHEFGIVPALSVGPISETTGAGDAFNGGLATALSEGKTSIDAVRFGCVAASISVTRAGTAASMPSRKEVEKIIRLEFC